MHMLQQTTMCLATIASIVWHYVTDLPNQISRVLLATWVLLCCRPFIQEQCIYPTTAARVWWCCACRGARLNRGLTHTHTHLTWWITRYDADVNGGDVVTDHTPDARAQPQLLQYCRHISHHCCMLRLVHLQLLSGLGVEL
jgi:hypothetical protein